MNGSQKLGLVVVSGALGFSAFNLLAIPVQAAVLTQTYMVNLKQQPVNGNLNALPKFNSLLGTLLRAYVTVESTSTMNSDISIVPASNVTGTTVTNGQIAVNLPSLKADPNLVLSLLANPPERSIESTANGTVSRSYGSAQYLNMFSGCTGDLIASIAATPATVTYAGKVVTDSKLTISYEYESETVPEPTIIGGAILAFGLGCWWKRMVGKKTF